MPTQPRAVLYLRLSESDDASTSISRQEADLRARADREGWEVVEVLVDDGLSGRRDRDKAEAALRLLSTGRADVLAVWKFDRWSRQGLSAVARLIETLDDQPKALFVADRDGLASTQPAWRIIAAVLSEVARMEAENTQLRVQSSIAALRGAGRFPGGNVPYGYATAAHPSGSGRTLVPDPVEAPVVRQIFDEALSGASLYAISQRLNADGVRPRRAKHWTIQSVRQLLTGEAVLGRSVHRGETVKGADGLPRVDFPPLVTVEDALRVREQLAPRPTKARRKRAARLASGLLVCSGCGATLQARTNGSGLVSFRCPTPSAGRPCADQVAVSANAVEDYLAHEFLSRYGSHEVTYEVPEEVRDSTRLREVQAEIAEVADRLRSAKGPDLDRLMRRFSLLKISESEAEATPPERVVRIVRTGMTYAEVFGALTPVRVPSMHGGGEVVSGGEPDRLPEARAYLSGALDGPVVVHPGRPGPTGLDPTRLALTWRTTDTSAALSPPSSGGE